MNIYELKEALDSLNTQAHDIYKMTGYETFGELSSIEFDPKDPDQAFLYDELYRLIHKLDEVSIDLDYLSRPIRYEGFLSLNDRGRYELCGRELTNGSSLEVEVYDDFYNRNVWWPGTLQHNGRSYYLISKPELDLEGRKARVRG